MFDGVLLEKDNNLREDSIYHQMNDEVLKRDADPIFNSTTTQSIKKMRTVNVSDSSSLIEVVLLSIGKFKLFEVSPEYYLNQVSTLLKDKIVDDQDSIDFVNNFFSLLGESLHKWFFEHIYQSSTTFSEFKSMFVDAIQFRIYETIKSVSLGIDSFLKTISKSDKELNCYKLKIYFERKSEILNQIFKMNKTDCKLFSLCFLDFDVYQTFIPLIKDDMVFNSLLKIKDSSFNISTIEKDQDDSAQNLIVNAVDVEELKNQVKELQNENDLLQKANNKLTDDNISIQEELDQFKDDKLQKNNEIILENLTKSNSRIKELNEENKKTRKQMKNLEEKVKELEEALEAVNNGISKSSEALETVSNESTKQSKDV